MKCTAAASAAIIVSSLALGNSEPVSVRLKSLPKYQESRAVLYLDGITPRVGDRDRVIYLKPLSNGGYALDVSIVGLSMDDVFLLGVNGNLKGNLVTIAHGTGSSKTATVLIPAGDAPRVLVLRKKKEVSVAAKPDSVKVNSGTDEGGSKANVSDDGYDVVDSFSTVGLRGGDVVALSLSTGAVLRQALKRSSSYQLVRNSSTNLPITHDATGKEDASGTNFRWNLTEGSGGTTLSTGFGLTYTAFLSDQDSYRALKGLKSLFPRGVGRLGLGASIYTDANTPVSLLVGPMFEIGRGSVLRFFCGMDVTQGQTPVPGQSPFFLNDKLSSPTPEINYNSSYKVGTFFALMFQIPTGGK